MPSDWNLSITFISFRLLGNMPEIKRIRIKPDIRKIRAQKINFFLFRLKRSEWNMAIIIIEAKKASHPEREKVKNKVSRVSKITPKRQNLFLPFCFTRIREQAIGANETRYMLKSIGSGKRGRPPKNITKIKIGK